MTLKQEIQKKLLPQELRLLRIWATNYLGTIAYDDLPAATRQKIFDIYCSAGEVPYGVMTGDDDIFDDWVQNKLLDEMQTEEGQDPHEEFLGAS